MQVPENKARGDSTRREEDERAGGGKVIRDRMGQSQVRNAAGAADTVITNARDRTFHRAHGQSGDRCVMRRA